MDSQDRDSVEQVGKATGGKQNIIPLLQAKSSSFSKPFTNIKHVKIVYRKELGLLGFRQRAAAAGLS